MKAVLKKHGPCLAMCGIAVLFIFTRFFRLDTIPYGINLDEAVTGYNAWSLSQYGVDRYLKSWPLYFRNFHGGQSAMYTYICALLFKIFGYNIWLMRLPGVVFSFLTVIFGMKIVGEVWPDSKLTQWAAGLLTIICPYFIMASRFGLDCNLMLGASMVFLYYFIRAVKIESWKYYTAAGITGGLALYTYALAYFVLPIFLLLALFYCIAVRKFSFGKWVLMAIPMGLLALPLILVQVVTIFDLNEMQLGIFTVTKLTSNRGTEFGLMTRESIIKALRSVFIGDEWIHNSIPGRPILYGVTIPLAMLGICSAIVKTGSKLCKRKLEMISFPLLWFLAVLLLECHIEANINKANAIYFVVVLLAIEGMRVLLQVWRTKCMKFLLSGAAVVGYMVCFWGFAGYYYGGDYTVENYPMEYFDVTVTEAVAFIEDNPQYGPKGTYLAETPVHFAISTLKSPYELMFEECESDNIINEYWHCINLPEIEEGYNYIVRDIYYGEYTDKLQALGFSRIDYGAYSLFCKE